LTADEYYLWGGLVDWGSLDEVSVVVQVSEFSLGRLLVDVVVVVVVVEYCWMVLLEMKGWSARLKIASGVAVKIWLGVLHGDS
jgi:hypothetical protein